jgi:ATP-dependent protease HslVU (ClpYQ) peptidase subunit
VTIIVGLVTERRVVLASDGMSPDGSGTVFSNPHKVREVAIAEGETVVVGTTGRTALGSLFAYRVKVDGVPDPGDVDGADEWAHTIAEAITGLAKDNGLTDKDGDMDGAALLAWRTHLWDISDNLALRIDRFAALGAGADVALGALDVLHDDAHVNPDHAVRRAVTAACRWHAACRPPVTVLSTSS